MQIIHSPEQLKLALRGQSNVALVPTMGNLHAGHLGLVVNAKRYANIVVVSVFVNPLQFGINEDFSRYPRTLAEDARLLDKVGADILFAPSIEDIYPNFDGTALNQTVIVTPPFADILCGAFRPGHFSGVATVVLKFLNLVTPDYAVFGKKDFQQLVIIRELVRQLNLPTTILATETVREAGGLALSSRNNYLETEERARASLIYCTLKVMAGQAQQGRNIAEICVQAKLALEQNGFAVDYAEIRSSTTLAPPNATNNKLVALVAAFLGQTRLIDNIEFSMHSAI